MGGRADAHSYERLEFLGDSILGAFVATELFRRFPDLREGELSKIKSSVVSGATLAPVAESLGLGECILFGDSERGSDARGMHSALENVFEACVGALFLDGGFEAAGSFVLETLSPYITDDALHVPDSPKSVLQERLQALMEGMPTYKIVDESGPAHARSFTAVAMSGGRRIGRGSGSSKKEAETAAAADALSRMDSPDEQDGKD